jgi:5'-methylthioadenosine phosphorylase
MPAAAPDGPRQVMPSSRGTCCLPLLTACAESAIRGHLTTVDLCSAERVEERYVQLLGIISGTAVLQEKGIFANLRETASDTRFGRALVFRSDAVAVIPRHGKDRQRHLPPHLVNHQANVQALKDLGVREVLGVNSTGSLKRRLKPGTLCVPDDYLLLTAGPTTVRDKPLHITPALDAAVRLRLLQAAKDCASPVVDGGVYWQTAGPRLETRAEIAMMSRFADLVGMTMASEAIIAQELELPYASLCSIDNYAHGIRQKELTMDAILRHASHSAETIHRILTRYAERFAG